MVRLYVYDEGQCDPKKCTGRRLARFNLAQEIASLRRVPYGSIVLTPYSQKAISREDASRAEAHGLVVLDLSWKNIETIPKIKSGTQGRALPFLLAANQVNWGKPLKLSSAEALAAALFIMGFKDQARETLSKFSFGDEFFRLNREPLERYSAASTSAEVVAIQLDYLQEEEPAEKGP